MGQIMLIEFTEQDASVFQAVCEVLKRSPNFKWMSLQDKTMLSLSSLEIDMEKRKAFFDHQEILLTTKEFNLLSQLAANEGRTFTYGQLYRNIWNQEPLGNERNVVGCHIRSLRRKLSAVDKDGTIRIGCVREVGYCLERMK